MLILSEQEKEAVIDRAVQCCHPREELAYVQETVWAAIPVAVPRLTPPKGETLRGRVPEVSVILMAIEAKRRLGAMAKPPL